MPFGARTEICTFKTGIDTPPSKRDTGDNFALVAPDLCIARPGHRRECADPLSENNFNSVAAKFKSDMFVERCGAAETSKNDTCSESGRSYKFAPNRHP